MKLLALETSTEACSVAITVDHQLAERLVLEQQHSARLLGLIDELLAETGLRLAQLDAIAFGRGPGMFTGLRIGVGVVQGLAFGADLPVIAVSSLAALAQGQEAERVLAALDARMSQVYWGAYERGAEGVMALVGREAVLAPEEVPVPAGAGWIGAGSGWDRYAERLMTRLGARVARWHAGCYPLARHVAALARVEAAHGRTLTAEEALPVYLREQVAQPPRR